MIWPATNSSVLPHCSHHFRWDWFELILARVPRPVIKISSLTTGNAHSDPLKHKHQFRHTLLRRSFTPDIGNFFFFCFVLFLWRPSVLFHSFAFTSTPPPSLSLSPCLSPSTSSPRPLFLTTGHYELPALTPGNYGNSFSLDYWRTVAQRVPSGDFIIIIRCACERGGAPVHELIQ